MNLKIINLKNPDTAEIIVGQGNFSVKTVDDIYAALLAAAPNIKCGVAMNESKPKLVRFNGNDPVLARLASEAAKEIAAGHIFVIYMKDAFPINVLPALKGIPTVVNLFVATSNPLQLIVAETDLGRAVLGAVDGTSANAVENEFQKKERRELVEKLGFKPAQI